MGGDHLVPLVREGWANDEIGEGCRQGKQHDDQDPGGAMLSIEVRPLGH
jgi:hypothetical protein